MEFSKDKAASTTSFSVISVFNRTFATLFKKPGILFGLGLVAALPVGLLLILASATASEDLVTYVASPVDLVLSLVLQGAITHVVCQTLMGRPALFSESILAGMGRIVALFGLALLMGLGMFFGFLLLIVPGIMLFCMWSVAIPVCVMERKGVMASLKRSAELTRGRRLSIFGLFLLTGATWMVLVFIAGMFVGLSLGKLVFSSIIGKIVLTVMISILLQVMLSVMEAVLYYDLRGLKEGRNLADLANAFD